MPRRRWAALLRALPVVASVRLLLWLIPFSLWRRRLARALRTPPLSTKHRRPSVTAEDITWAVVRAARLVPGATCLTQSLAAQVLLARAGYASRLRLGIARAEAGAVHAHAWLEHDPDRLGVGTSTETFTPLMVADESDPATKAASPWRESVG